MRSEDRLIEAAVRVLVLSGPAFALGAFILALRAFVLADRLVIRVAGEVVELSNQGVAQIVEALQGGLKATNTSCDIDRGGGGLRAARPGTLRRNDCSSSERLGADEL